MRELLRMSNNLSLLKMATGDSVYRKKKKKGQKMKHFLLHNASQKFC